MEKRPNLDIYQHVTVYPKDIKFSCSWNEKKMMLNLSTIHWVKKGISLWNEMETTGNYWYHDSSWFPAAAGFQFLETAFFT